MLVFKLVLKSSSSSLSSPVAVGVIGRGILLLEVLALLLKFERGVRDDDAEGLVDTGVGTQRHLGGDTGGVTSLSSSFLSDCSVDRSVLLTVSGWISTLGVEKEKEGAGCTDSELLQVTDELGAREARDEVGAREEERVSLSMTGEVSQETRSGDSFKVEPGATTGSSIQMVSLGTGTGLSWF